MIRRIVAWLVSNGVDDLVLNLHHRPETLTASLGDGRDLGARVRYSWELPRFWAAPEGRGWRVRSSAPRHSWS